MGESGQPAAFLIHTQIGMNNIFMHLRLQKKLQRMRAPEGVPDTVVAIVIMTVIFMYFSIKSQIFSIYTVIVHPGKDAVQRCIKNGFLWLAAFYPHFS